jgi:hypothetical protein
VAGLRSISIVEICDGRYAGSVDRKSPVVARGWGVLHRWWGLTGASLGSNSNSNSNRNGGYLRVASFELRVLSLPELVVRSLELRAFELRGKG